MPDPMNNNPQTSDVREEGPPLLAYSAMATALERDGMPNAAHYLRDAAERLARFELTRHSVLSTVNVDEAKVAALTEAHRVALHHSNYGHIEGNRRAFVIADDIQRRISAALSTKAPLSMEGLEGC
jgi:hypothetical protein